MEGDGIIPPMRREEESSSDSDNEELGENSAYAKGNKQPHEFYMSILEYLSNILTTATDPL